MGQANSQTIFFSTSIVMWQVIQRVRLLGNVRHSTLTWKKVTVVFTAFIELKKKAQIRKLNPLFAYPEWYFIYTPQTQCEKLHGYKRRCFQVPPEARQEWPSTQTCLRARVCVYVCVCEIDYWPCFTGGPHTYVHLMSVWDSPRLLNLWRNTCSHPNTDMPLPPCLTEACANTALLTTPDKGYCCQMTGGAKLWHVQKYIIYGQPMRNNEMN